MVLLLMNSSWSVCVGTVLVEAVGKDMMLGPLFPFVSLVQVQYLCLGSLLNGLRLHHCQRPYHDDNSIPFLEVFPSLTSPKVLFMMMICSVKYDGVVISGNLKALSRLHTIRHSAHLGVAEFSNLAPVRMICRYYYVPIPVLVFILIGV